MSGSGKVAFGGSISVLGLLTASLFYSCSANVEITPPHAREGWRPEIVGTAEHTAVVSSLPPFELRDDEGRRIVQDNARANVRLWKWAKLVNSSMILAPFGMLGLQSWEATEIPEVFDLCVRLGRETMAVSAALGVTIDPIFGMSAEEFKVSTDEIVKKLLRAILIHHGETARQVRGVVLQDYHKGRLTETDYLNGLIARKGREAGVPTPANDAVVEINRRILAGELKPERSNIAIANKLLGA